MPSFNATCSEGFYDAATLAELRYDVLVRLGYAAQAANPPPGMGILVDSFLQSAQRLLYRKYKALHTERIFTWQMTVGEQFYGLRNNLDDCSKKLEPSKIRGAWVGDMNGAWIPLTRGINPSLYTSASYNGLPTRFEVRQMIEVFPAPDVAYTLRVQGDFGLLRFTENTDICTLDSEAVFLWALANAKNHYGQQDAKDVAAQANTLIGDLTAGTHGGRRYVPGEAAPCVPPRPVLLPVGG